MVNILFIKYCNNRFFDMKRKLYFYENFRLSRVINLVKLFDFSEYVPYFFSVQFLHLMSTDANQLGLASLGVRRHIMGANFFDGLLADRVDSPTLLSYIHFKIFQRSSCSTAAFLITLYTINYLLNEPMRGLMSNDNTYPTFLN